MSPSYAPLGRQIVGCEKVENNEDFEENTKSTLVITLFQGYFFEKPVICKSKSIRVSTLRYMEILSRNHG